MRKNKTHLIFTTEDFNMHNAHIIIDGILIGLCIWVVTIFVYKTTELVFKYTKYRNGSK